MRRECGGNATGSEGTTRVPAKDETALDARKTGPIKVAFLPFRYNELVPDTSAEALKTYSDEIMKKFGTTEVVLTVLPEFGDYSGTVNLNTLLDAVRIKRGQDGPPADVYYYGLVRPTQDFSSYCNGYCTTGVAYQPGGTAAFRVGIGIAFGDTRSAGTFAHELGHNHDRPHAPCGGAGNPDAAFPYADGGIGTWGYDAVAAQLKNPATHKDLMGYCSPAWVSDYNFALMSDVVAKVNENTFKVLSEPVTWDALSVEPSGISWSAPQVMTEFPKEAWTEAVVYDGKGNELTRVDAFRFVRSEDQGYLLVVPPRKPGWYAIGAVGGPAIVYP